MTVGEGGRFPDLEKQLAYYENSFDRVKAKEEGIIVPREGFSPECDSSQKEVKLISEELDQYLKEQRKRLGCQVRTTACATLSCGVAHFCDLDYNVLGQWQKPIPVGSA